MIRKKIITFGVVGSILLGGTVLGAYTSLSQSDDQSKAIGQDGVLASELTVAPISYGDDGIEVIGTLTNEADMYNVVLDYFIELDAALNSDMKYIAVNFDVNIDDENKDNVLENLKKYNVDIIEGNLEDLKAKGLGDEYGNLEGILLSISDIKIESENKIIIEGSKYRSGLGSVSAQVTINNDNGTWKIVASTPKLAS